MSLEILSPKTRYDYTYLIIPRPDNHGVYVHVSYYNDTKTSVKGIHRAYKRRTYV